MIGASIIIPTLDRPTVVYSAVKQCMQQACQQYEVIVVDQSEVQNDALYKLSQVSQQKLRYFHVSFRGLPEARNFGAQQSKFDLLVFVDDDVQIPQSFLEAHLDAHSDGTIGIVGGRIISDPADPQCRNVGRLRQLTCTALGGFNSTVSQFVDHVRGCNFSVKRDVFIKVGGFDENFNIGAALYEETDFCLRVRKLHYKIFFSACAALFHEEHDQGGCRIKDGYGLYCKGMAHNRTVLILRHVAIRFWPSAFARLVALGFSYALTSRSIAPLLGTVEGILLATRNRTDKNLKSSIL